MENYFIEKDNKKICKFGVYDNYVWFVPTKYTKEYKTYILKNVKNVFKELLEKHKYLYTFSEDIPYLNKWHTYVGMKKEEQFKYKNKLMNIWVNK